VLHEASTACAVLRDTGAGHVLSFAGASGIEVIEQTFAEQFTEFRRASASFEPDNVDRAAFEAYSARNVTAVLAGALDRALPAVTRAR
jgi:hypothetical protein